jgi:molybdopterin molybdotransferase
MNPQHNAAFFLFNGNPSPKSNTKGFGSTHDNTMISLEQALEQLLKSVRPVEGVETIGIDSAVGRFVAEDVSALSALPPFDNSAMDGYAVRSADVKDATTEKPARLRQVGKVPAGQFFSGSVGKGECVRIFTGSPLPEGADAIVMQEDTRADADVVEILDAVKPWENIRFRGEDVKQGARIAAAGARVTPQLAALLSACGVGQLKVRRKLRIAIVATGKELKRPGTPLAPGEIYESNRILVSSLVKAIGCEPIVHETVEDELRATVAAIQRASEADAIVTCGGVSVGEYDFVKTAIAELGGRVDFWRVAIKPGKPFAHAVVLGKPLFGLPGNPVSALVTFWLLVRPTILRMAGTSDVLAKVSLGKLAEEISNPGDRRHFVRVTIDSEGNVRASGPQASHRLASLAAANGLLDVPADATWEIGRTVKVILLE